MRKFSLPIHLTFSEVSFVYMAKSPSEYALTIHNISVKLALISASICINSEALTMLFVADPLSLVLRDHTVLISLAAEQLKTMSVSDHFKLLSSQLGSHRFDLTFVRGHVCFDDLSIRLSDVGNLSVVHGTICCVSEALIMSLSILFFLICGDR